MFEDIAEATSWPVAEVLVLQLLVVINKTKNMASLKTVQDLLVGVHAAAAAEAIGLASAAGLDTQMVYDIIHNAAGNSAVFADIVPKLLAQQNVQDFDMVSEILLACCLLCDSNDNYPDAHS